MADVTLTAAIRSNLLSLQGTANLLSQTQLRLSTGLKVNSALDNPTAFFAAQSLNNRSSDLSNLLDGQGQAIQTVQAANNGITAITNFLQQSLALAKQALANANANGGTNLNSATDATTLANITGQITQTAADSSYQGSALLNGVGNDLTVAFNESGSGSLTIASKDHTASGLGVGSLLLDNTANINTAITAINTAITTVRTDAAGFANSLSIIQTRQDFTNNLINTLKAGADKLVVADKNEEGAKLLALQTTSQLGITSLSLASQANQSILRLFP